MSRSYRCTPRCPPRNHWIVMEGVPSQIGTAHQSARFEFIPRSNLARFEIAVWVKRDRVVFSVEAYHPATTRIKAPSDRSQRACDACAPMAEVPPAFSGTLCYNETTLVSYVDGAITEVVSSEGPCGGLTPDQIELTVGILLGIAFGIFWLVGAFAALFVTYKTHRKKRAWTRSLFFCLVGQG